MYGRQTTGHRYLDDQKMFALSLYHASPKWYRMLRKEFILSSLSTLKLCMRNVNIRPGFHSAIFEGLRLKAEHMGNEYKLFAIVFDEMCIKENLCYDASQDCVEGLEYMTRWCYSTIMTWHDFPYINNQSMTMDEQTLVNTLCRRQSRDRYGTPGRKMSNSSIQREGTKYH